MPNGDRGRVVLLKQIQELLNSASRGARTFGETFEKAVSKFGDVSAAQLWLDSFKELGTAYKEAGIDTEKFRVLLEQLAVTQKNLGGAAVLSGTVQQLAARGILDANQKTFDRQVKLAKQLLIASKDKAKLAEAGRVKIEAELAREAKALSKYAEQTGQLQGRTRTEYERGFIERKRQSKGYLQDLSKEQDAVGDWSGAATTRFATARKGAGEFFSAMFKGIGRSLTSIAAYGGAFMILLQAFDRMRQQGTATTRVLTAMGVSHDELTASTAGGVTETARLRTAMLTQQKDVSTSSAFVRQLNMRFIGLEKFLNMAATAYKETAFGGRLLNEVMGETHTQQLMAIRDTALLGQVFQQSTEAGIQFAIQAFQDLRLSGEQIPNLYMRIVRGAREAGMNFGEFFKIVQAQLPTMHEMGIGTGELIRNFAGLSEELFRAGAPVTFIQERFNEIMKLTQVGLPRMLAEAMAAGVTGPQQALAQIQTAVQSESLLTHRLEVQRKLLDRLGLMPETAEQGFGVRGMMFLQQQWGVSPMAVMRYQKEFYKLYTEGVKSDVELADLTKEIRSFDDLGLKTMMDQKTILEMIADAVGRMADLMIELVAAFGGRAADNRRMGNTIQAEDSRRVLEAQIGAGSPEAIAKTYSTKDLLGPEY